MPKVVIAALVWVVIAPAFAGFTISVKPLPKPEIPVQKAPVAPVEEVKTSPVKPADVTPEKLPVVFQVGKGEVLRVAAKGFLSQFGWNVAWMAGDVIAGDQMTFSGKDHEEALAAFLRHYNLLGERFESEKGYVIRRSESTGAK